VQPPLTKRVRTLVRRILLILTVVLLLFPGDHEALSQNVNTHNKLVAIVCSDSSIASTRSIKGIRQSLKRSDYAVEFNEMNIKSEGEDAIISKLNLLKPDLVITVGSPSTIFIKGKFPEIPLIFSTVLNPETSGIITDNENSLRNITGASLDIPIEIQFKKFMRVHPNLKSVGVIYTEQTSMLIEEARQIAPQLGLELTAIKITVEKDVPKALDSLCRVVDGIWTTADDFIYTPQATKFMILASLRNRKPIMGFTPSFVKSGALMGLNYDYKDIGRSAGEQAIRFFNGEEMSKIPIAIPGMIYLHINMKTANQLGIDIDQSLVDVSKEIYQ
jgi:putative tryptophan/tyrosine transport system substrate-binding protein